MKKEYTKPMIMFESFTLCTNIASGCETQTNLPTNYEGCGLEASGVGTIFLQGMNLCSLPVDNENGDGSVEVHGDTICYHVPTGDNNLFAS